MAAVARLECNIGFLVAGATGVAAACGGILVAGRGSVDKEFQQLESVSKADTAGV